jgi:phosphatidylglycerol:prolipoprotein diacylglycerol transferase
MSIPFPDIRPEMFTVPALHLGGLTLGPFPVRWYALAYIVGILLGWRYAVGLVRNPRLWGERTPGVSILQLDDLIVWLTLGVILGGRLGYVIFYMLPLAEQRNALAADPLEILRVWHGGMSFHGGLIGVSLAMILFVRSKGLRLLGVSDVVAACVPLGLCFGRIANFINGELWGRPTDLPWGMVFCGHYIAADAGGGCAAGYGPRHPSQLYEATLEGVVLFLALRLATHRLGWLRRPGAVTGLFLVGYAAARIALENVRMPDAGLRDLPLGLTVGIMLSVPMLIGGAWLIWRSRRPEPELSEAHEPA